MNIYIFYFIVYFFIIIYLFFSKAQFKNSLTQVFYTHWDSGNNPVR